LEEIDYFCGMNDIIRETFHSVEYDEYYASLDEKTKTKYDYVELIYKDSILGQQEVRQEPGGN